MLIQLGKLEIRKSADYDNEVAKALKEMGFTLIIECETTTDRYYTIAKEGESEWEEFS